MIDWLSVAANSLWILGCAVILAAVSYYVWVASQASQSILSQFEKPAFLTIFFLGLALIGLGLLGTSDGTLQIALSAALVAGSLLAVARVYQTRPKDKQSE